MSVQLVICHVILSTTVSVFLSIFVSFNHTSSLSFLHFHPFFWNGLFILFLCPLWSFGCPGPGKGCSCAPILLLGSGGPRRWKRTLANGVLCVHFDTTQLHPSASLIGRRHLAACACVAVCVQLDCTLQSDGQSLESLIAVNLHGWPMRTSL